MVRVILAPIWEFWNLSNGDYTFIGVLLMVYGAYGFGFAQGRWPDAKMGSDQLPLWVKLAFVAAIVGFLMALVASSGDYIPEDRPGP